MFEFSDTVDCGLMYQATNLQPIEGIGSESPRTTIFNMYYNGIKCMLRDGCAGIPNLSPIE